MNRREQFILISDDKKRLNELFNTKMREFKGA